MTGNNKHTVKEELIQFHERPFVGRYKLTSNLLYPYWDSLVDLLPEGKGVCLDVGCDDGHHQRLIEKKGWRWVGCDIIKQRQRGYIIADALYLPLKSDSIDAVFSNCVLEHMKDPFVAMHEVARVLKPSGRIYMSVAFMEPFHGSYFHISHWGLEELATRSGLRIIQVEPGATTFVPIWRQLFDLVGYETYRIGVPPIVFFIEKILRVFGYLFIVVFFGKKSWQFQKFQGYFERLPLKLAGHIKCIMEKPEVSEYKGDYKVNNNGLCYIQNAVN